MERSGNRKLEIRYSRNPAHVLIMLKIINDGHAREHYENLKVLQLGVLSKGGGELHCHQRPSFGTAIPTSMY